jgi:ribonuclease T1
MHTKWWLFSAALRALLRAAAHGGFSVGRMVIGALLVALMTGAAISATPSAGSQTAAAPQRARVTPLADIAWHALPAEAQHTLALIQRGGPFPYRKDGTTFANRERHLPPQPRGYYAEYTVPTPGRRDRGARRIVAGRGATGSFATSGEYYYTADHYETFRRVVSIER